MSNLHQFLPGKSGKCFLWSLQAYVNTGYVLCITLCSKGQGNAPRSIPPFRLHHPPNIFTGCVSWYGESFPCKNSFSKKMLQNPFFQRSIQFQNTIFRRFYKKPLNLRLSSTSVIGNSEKSTLIISMAHHFSWLL